MPDLIILRTVVEESFAERSSIELGGTLVKADGSVIGSSLVQTLTLTLYALDASRTIVNGVNGTDIKNADRGTLTEEGLLTIALELDDAVILNTVKKAERRVALVRWTYLAPGNKQRGGGHEWLFTLVNMERLT